MRWTQVIGAFSAEPASHFSSTTTATRYDKACINATRITKLITQRQKLRTEIVRTTMIGVQNQQFQEHRLADKNGQVTKVSKVDHSKAEPQERNSENNDEWGTKSLLKERKAELITQRQKLKERKKSYEIINYI